MSEHALGSLPPDRLSDASFLVEPQANAPTGRGADASAEDANSLTRFEQDQLAREYADIERASVALRLGQPELRSWSTPAPPMTATKPRAFWLLIGILWLSTAVVTMGAVAVIAKLAG
ncbi:MAG TPA: hypothetical protein VHX43_00410 [Xanthobacteraceae bacterium]|jgi:hypothetical protein|nr:hypothetical protein [Xanthobacteraceae bacterium]